MHKNDVSVRLHRPVVSGNQHSVLIVTDLESLTLQINVKQLEEKIIDDKTKKSWRHAVISGPIEPMLDMEFYSGMFLPGKIRIIESFLPVIENEPELFIKRDRNGNICRVNGKVVYRTEYYTQNHLEEDIYIEE